MDTHNNNKHTTQHDFASRLREKIESEQITPRSKWVSIFIQLLLWVPWIFVTLIGVVGVAGIIFTVAFSGWQHYGAVQTPPFLYVFQTVSVVWIMCLALFGAIVIKAFRITQKGYRVSPFTIITLSLVVSVAGGSLLYIGDMVLRQNIYLRRPIQVRQQQLWDSPYKGTMVGILKQEEERYFITDTQGKTWSLMLEEAGTLPYKEGDAVRAIGAPLDEETFKTCALLPFSVGVAKNPRQIETEPPTDIQKNRVYETAGSLSCVALRSELFRGERNRRVRP